MFLPELLASNDNVLPGYATMAYVIAGVCFILSLGGLSKHESARRGNLLGIIGIAIAVLATLISGRVNGNFAFWLVPMIVGSLIGALLAGKVKMESLPQLVAILHSFVGLAAVLVGVGSFFGYTLQQDAPSSIVIVTNEVVQKLSLIHRIEVVLGVFIGAITFTGSIVAWGKLQGNISSKPLILSQRHLINLAMVGLCLLLAIAAVSIPSTNIGLIPLVIMSLIAFALGWHLVMAIGGADMPVVVSMLNSYSGWAAAATGFLLDNDLLIITGALVGSSGAILSYIMCRAMNRSIVSVILGGFGTDAGTVVQSAGEDLHYHSISADETAEELVHSRNVIVVPGYGMAVAQAQHPIREIMENLKARGIRTRFAIHPVAGRLPGHMNVLLAEARIPYDIVLEMDEINADFSQTDMVLVIGANDIVNPAALDDTSSPIYGMPVLEAWRAGKVVVLKRSMASGYSGIDNPLFYRENTNMLFGDARESINAILAHLQNGAG
jgi:NAD(P) transhydrogenase subunit beta